MSFDAISLQLQEWIQSTAKTTHVELSPPSLQESNSKTPHINLYLFELKRPVLISIHDRDKAQVLLRYLVSAWASDEKKSHRLLGELFIAASQTSMFEVSLEAMPCYFWQGLQLPPRPCFIIEMLYTKTWPKKEFRNVEEPLIIKTQTI